MVNWMDPQILARTSRAYGAFVLTLVGMATWDVLRTLAFDISIIRGKRPWRWPMLLYFICRICLIMHIYAYAVNLNAILEIPCQEVIWISKVTDAIGTCGSSLILVLRTRAVWNRDIKISVGLGLLFLGQIAVWCQSKEFILLLFQILAGQLNTFHVLPAFRFSVSKWDPQRNLCAVISTAPRPLLVTVFAYTMAFDLVILALCAWKLLMARGSSNLAHVLLRDGIGYFLAAFCANLVQMVMAALALSPVMNIMALPFALVVSVIASTTVFRNVFIIYDAWARDSGCSPSKYTSASGPTLPQFAARASSGRMAFSEGPPEPVDSYPLREFKSQDFDSVAVHKVVDVDIDDSQGQVMSNNGRKHPYAF